MPLLLLVVAGIVLLLATSYATLGWVFIGLGVGLFLLWLVLFLGILGAAFNLDRW